jgi:hypothetical protein
MKKSIFNAFLATGLLTIATVSQAEVFTCPTLRSNEIYTYFEWIDTQGVQLSYGAWNHAGWWRLWINGDSYFTPKDSPVVTRPLAAHFSATTNTWYLKCLSADASVGPRTNVWPYKNCEIDNGANGFVCN